MCQAQNWWYIWLCHILLAKASHQGCPSLTSWWEVLPFTTALSSFPFLNPCRISLLSKWWIDLRFIFNFISLKQCSFLQGMLFSFSSYIYALKKFFFWGRSQDGGGIGRGDHFLSYKFIERTIERWTNFTKQLLIASRGHQAPRKATHCLRREAGQNIKDKKGDKRARDGDPSREGSLNRGSFKSPGNPRAGGSGGSFQISEENPTGRRN